MKRPITAILIAVILCLGAVVTRAMWQGKAALADGDAAFTSNDKAAAIRLWRRAARWYVPLASHVSDAYARLEALGEEAEKAGDTQTALAAWQGVRGSILATRSFYVPYSEKLDPANQHIASLMAKWEEELARSEGAASPASGQVELTPEQRREWHYQLLTRNEAPSILWSMVAIFGFVLWIGGAFRFAWRGFDSENRLVKPVLAGSGILFVVGMSVWLTGLYLA